MRTKQGSRIEFEVQEEYPVFFCGDGGEERGEPEAERGEHQVRPRIAVIAWITWGKEMIRKKNSERRTHPDSIGKEQQFTDCPHLVQNSI